MKRNAIIRIIAWTVSLVILVGLPIKGPAFLLQGRSYDSR